MRVVILSYTRRAGSLNVKVGKCLLEQGMDVTCYGFHKYKEDGLVAFTKTAEVLDEEFGNADAILFIGAFQIAVRSIAPYVKSKVTDPAVLGMDEMAGYIVPLLSGHIGGANALASKIAAITSATPVITTATDLHGLFAVDVWAKEQGLQIEDMGLAKEVSAEILEGKKIGFFCEEGLEIACPSGLTEGEAELGICVTKDSKKQPFEKTLRLYPKDIALGIGCRKGKTYEELVGFVTEVLDELEIMRERIAFVGSIDLKKEEAGLCKFCKEWKVPFITYTAEELKAVEGEFTASSFVAGTTGVDNVCERSAVKVSGGGALLVKKRAKNGMTIAIAKRR